MSRSRTTPLGYLTLVVLGCACNKTSTGGAPSPSASVSASAVASSAPSSPSAPKSYPLPGVSGPVTLDLLAYNRATGQVWIPVGETGSVDVFTITTSTFTRVDGFKTSERQARGRKRMMGPSAAAVGDGRVYVSNRASSEVCVVKDASLEVGRCVTLPSPPDVIGYVSGAHEVWVTTPKDRSIVVLDASQAPREELKTKVVIKTDGSPECYAVDEQRGIFYTNLEDKNRTLAIDIKTHSVKATWTLGCSDGPRGVAVDITRNFVFVACTDSLQILNGSRDGARLGTFDTGAGVDAIEYFAASKELYVAAGKAARMSVVRFSNEGAPSLVTAVTTAPGARNPVVDSNGVAYLVDPETAHLLAFPASSSH